MNALLGVVTVTEAAELFQVSHWTIRHHIDSGNIAYRKCSNGVLLLDLHSLNHYYSRLYRQSYAKTPNTWVQAAVR